MLSWFKCTWQLVEIWQKKINIAEREINVCTKSVLMDCLINLWQQKMHFRIVILQAVNNHLPRDRRTLTHKIRWKKTMQFQVGISNKVSISLFPPKQHQKCPFYIVFWFPCSLKTDCGRFYFCLVSFRASRHCQSVNEFWEHLFNIHEYVSCHLIGVINDKGRWIVINSTSMPIERSKLLVDCRCSIDDGNRL